MEQPTLTRDRAEWARWIRSEVDAWAARERDAALAYVAWLAEDGVDGEWTDAEQEQDDALADAATDAHDRRRAWERMLGELPLFAYDEHVARRFEQLRDMRAGEGAFWARDEAARMNAGGVDRDGVRWVYRDGELVEAPRGTADAAALDAAVAAHPWNNTERNLHDDLMHYNRVIGMTNPWVPSPALAAQLFVAPPAAEAGSVEIQVGANPWPTPEVGSRWLDVGRGNFWVVAEVNDPAGAVVMHSDHDPVRFISTHYNIDIRDKYTQVPHVGELRWRESTGCTYVIGVTPKGIVHARCEDGGEHRVTAHVWRSEFQLIKEGPREVIGANRWAEGAK